VLNILLNPSNAYYLIATVVRQIWLRRNSIYGVHMVAPSDLLRRARNQVEVVCHAAIKTNSNGVVSHSAVGWLPPPVGYVKVN
jgi:hypothetical protein